MESGEGTELLVDNLVRSSNDHKENPRLPGYGRALVPYFVPGSEGNEQDINVQVDGSEPDTAGGGEATKSKRTRSRKKKNSSKQLHSKQDGDQVPAMDELVLFVTHGMHDQDEIDEDETQTGRARGPRRPPNAPTAEDVNNAFAAAAAAARRNPSGTDISAAIPSLHSERRTRALCQ
eukprot:scaffold104_cov375-Prasinococcus_capsulatus_cf.AAC.32